MEREHNLFYRPNKYAVAEKGKSAGLCIECMNNEALSKIYAFHIFRELLRTIDEEHNILHFVNRTPYTIELHWNAHTRSTFKRFTKLKSMQHICILTSFEDQWYAKVNENLMLFNDKNWFDCDLKFYSHVDVDVIITCPLLSLRDTALMKIDALIEKKDDIKSISLPQTLKTDIIDTKIKNNEKHFSYDIDRINEYYDFTNVVVSDMPYVVSPSPTYEYCKSLWRLKKFL